MTTSKKLLLLLVICTGYTTAFSQSPQGYQVSQPVLFLDSIYKKLDSFYASPLPSFIMRKSVDAMMTSLDPFTRFLDKEEADEFRLGLTAKYGGLGLSMLVVDSQVTIAEVFSDFPADKAGLMPGDVITEVNHFETRGDINATIDRLIGVPGTELKLSIKRPGNAQPLKLTLVREQIKLKSVPYYGILKNNIGYMVVTGITSNVSEDVKIALKDLLKQPLNGLILDLRNNMGGSLLQGVKIANLFIEKGKPIVSLKGRIHDTTYYANDHAVTTDLPLVVLTSNATASSAEVLTGALQDHDRALIMGQPTYGKGLVQTMYNTGNGSMAIITTGYYYTPSGRCIQSVDYAGLGGDNKKVVDTLQTEFNTPNGRKVKSGGGITPDIVTAPLRINPVMDCIPPQLLFKHALKFRQAHPSISSPLEFNISEQEVDAFLLQTELKNCSPALETTKKLAALKQTAESEGLKTIDPYISQIEKEIKSFQASMLANNRAFIRSMIEKEIAKIYYKASGGYAAGIKYDTEIARAIEVLSQPGTYKATLRLK